MIEPKRELTYYDLDMFKDVSSLSVIVPLIDVMGPDEINRFRDWMFTYCNQRLKIIESWKSV